MMDEKIIWEARAFVYRQFADTTRAPGVDETAATFALTHEEAASIYEVLDERHAFLLNPGMHDILMANQFRMLKHPSACMQTEKPTSQPVFNVTGQPAVSVPLHWNEAGLPIGMHFVGRWGDEATLFRLAGQLEKTKPWADKVPPGY